MRAHCHLVLVHDVHSNEHAMKQYKIIAVKVFEITDKWFCSYTVSNSNVAIYIL